MSIRVGITHETRYAFDRPVTISPHVLRLRPAPHCRTPIESYALHVAPDAHFVNWQQDPFGNWQARLVFPEKARELRIAVDLVAEMVVINPFDFFLEESARTFPFRYDEALAKSLSPYLVVTDAGPRLMAWLATVDRREESIIDFLVALNQRVYRDVHYTLRFDPGVKTCEQTLGDAEGACRDSGWLLVQILRHLGLAARFVSGYLVQLTSDEKSLDGPSGPAADFTDLHAWAEVYVPGAGWIGLDPTSGLFAGEGHIPLACTPDVASAAPVTGYTDECKVEFSYANQVTRLYEDPRVTKPYSDEQWAAIDALGEAVDAELVAGDVRLTLGGEPTFVSIDDFEGAEWNVDADGPKKRRLAVDLIGRLHDAFAAGGMLYAGQGKWYPGEPLPRWKLGLYWRRDGVPVWTNRALLADPERDGQATPELAERLAKRIATGLGLKASNAIPGYEDPFYFLWVEHRLPVDLDPSAAELDDARERQRLAKLLDRGLGTPVGYALPLAWNDAHGAWQSCTWDLRRHKLILIPGDSPMGYRLPLDSLPPTALDEVVERDPFATRAQLAVVTAGPGRQAVANAFRTALCVEPRGGVLRVFLPPIGHAEHWLLLVSTIEAAAAELGVAVVIEGYEPPNDWRMQRLMITPDPGVIEVNVHPAESWRQLVDVTTTLYAEARAARLGTEKFLVDGRHTGTGGGNHVTLGGSTPADSPLLRRPDLLRSLITYWQRHPGLSYLFSGLFVGPTSQAPRVDEARTETIYELEMAFAQIPNPEGAEVSPPWLGDRLLRHLLVDMTGNTHRAEFCIDKLYSPDGATGRVGLLELRAFEMPPHARMSLAQQLLMRALVAWFWRQPYKGGGANRLTRWATGVHDRFLLPSFVRMDFDDVIADLQRAGFGFDREWFAPHFEFRFPRIGEVRTMGIEVALRGALEPWHVMGEEGAPGGTVRYVDSSLERLEVKATGLNGNRHAITVNGRAMPMQPTGRVGEFVCGVRYRAWAPASALHPTIGVHAPLTFDVVDRWSERSLGGCRYHVAHPGGRNYDTFPVNAYEAESRRLARFEALGHTPGRMVVGSATPSREFPFTFDLRLG